nr:N-6 DNA methylase [Kribbella solani]
MSVEETTDATAELMLTLATPGAGPTVFDFACGTGTLLRTACARAMASGHAVRVFGQDASKAHARIAFARLALLAQQTNSPIELRIRAGDSLTADADPGLTVDTVVCNPPFGIQDWGHELLAIDERWEYGGLPPRTEPELAWVQHALAHLKPGGRAALLMPPAAASRSAGRQIRTELLRRGRLRAVLALPAGAVRGTSVGPHLWLLEHPTAEPDNHQVLLADLTNEEHLQTDQRSTAAAAWESGSSSGISHDVADWFSVLDLLEGQVDLTPGRRLRRPPPARADSESVIKTLDELRFQTANVTALLPESLRPSAASADNLQLMSVGTLLRHRVVALHRGRAPQVDLTSGPAIVSQDVSRGKGPSGRASADGLLIATNDILIPAIAEGVVARVATPDQIGALLGSGVHLLRVDPAQLDPWYVAGMLASRSNAHQAGMVLTPTRGTTRVDVKRLQIPLLPLQRQHEYGTAFRQLTALESQLSRTQAAGAEALRALADGLTELSLDPQDLSRLSHDPDHKENGCI